MQTHTHTHTHTHIQERDSTLKRELKIPHNNIKNLVVKQTSVVASACVSLPSSINTLLSKVEAM